MVRKEVQNFFCKLFHIYPGEERKAFLFALLGFLWAMGVTSGLKFADALFILHIGADSLPMAYIFTACIMVVLATFLLKAFHRFPAYRIFLFVLTIGFFFYGGAYLCMSNQIGLNSQWLWFALRIFGTVFFAVVVTCFWTFIDQYHHFQDAKRLYSLFSSMVFLGVACTGIIMRSGKVDFEHLTLFIMAILLMACYWITWIVRSLNPVHDTAEPEERVQSMHGIKEQIKSILTSRFTLLLMLGNFLTYLLLVITEYNYLSSFDLHFSAENTIGGDEEASLTLFMGQCLAVVSISNLLFGLFIYSRLVKRFGVISVLPITPLILLITFSGWPLTDSLMFPVMGYFVVEGTLYVIDDSNFNLLLNAVPSKLKYKIRIIIESFFEPVGMLISAFLLTILQIDSKILGLVLAACSLTVALLLRKYYVKAVYQNLSENAIHFQRNTQDWLLSLNKREEKLTKAHVLSILRQENPQARLFAAEAVLDFEDFNMLKQLMQKSAQWEDEIKIKFIELLSKSVFATHHLVLDTLEKWIATANTPELKGRLHFYFAKLGLLHPEKAISDLYSNNSMLKAAAIIALQNSWGKLTPKCAAENMTLATKQLQTLLESSHEDDVCIGIKTLGDAEMLIPFLKHPSTNIARTAAKCLADIAETPCAQQAKLIIEQLEINSDSEFRLACLKALCTIANSEQTKDLILTSCHFRPNERRLIEHVVKHFNRSCVPTLLNLTRDTTIPDRCRVLAGRILGSLAPAELKKHLHEILLKEIQRASFYFAHHHRIQADYPNIDLGLLKEALQTGFYSVMDFIIQLLGVSGEIEDCELLSRSIRSSNPKTLSQVVETLEKTCEHKIMRLLHPLVMHTQNDTGKQQRLNLDALLDKMSLSYARLDQLISAMLKQKLNIPNWKDSLQLRMGMKESSYQQFLRELMET